MLSSCIFLEAIAYACLQSRENERISLEQNLSSPVSCIGHVLASTLQPPLSSMGPPDAASENGNAHVSWPREADEVMDRESTVLMRCGSAQLLQSRAELEISQISRFRR